MMASSYADVLRITGLPASAYGEAMYTRGRELVARGLELSELVWDADEVLWDWVMSGARLLATIPLAAFGWLGHREWVAMRPGMIELLFGMHHAALELGKDPHVRIWTSGYPWRVWRILREVPGFDRLLGPPDALAEPERMASHPRVFTRPDYIRAMHDLIDPKARAERLAAMSEGARKTIESHLGSDPDSGFKIPELARFVGKDAFERARYLIDDLRPNVEWFQATGRHAIHVKSIRPRIAFGKIPHSAWSPARFLARSGHGVAAQIADALDALLGHETPAIHEAAVGAPAEGPPNRIVSILIPNSVLWREWIRPMRTLRKAMKARSG